MNIVKNVFLFVYLQNNSQNATSFECSECFDDKFNKITIANFYRNNLENNLKYDKQLLENIVNQNNINNYENTYFLFTIDFHKNFHHMMTELLGQILYYQKLNNPNIKILIKNNTTVLQYLNLLSFIDPNNIEIIEYNKLYFFNNIYVYNKPIKHKKLIFYMLTVNKYIIFKNINNIQYHEKIFLFRNNEKRKLREIDNLLEIAKQNNFYIYSPEDDNLENQIKLISNCKILLCELGAGCCNMFFTNNECKIIILSFLKGWSDKYLYYNNGILNRDITILQGKIITGNEHSCLWTIDLLLLNNFL